MPRYIAFLRALNVSGHNVVKMADLRRCFAALGFANVATYIQSGNVIFETPARSAAALERKIEAHLQQALGNPIATFLRTTTELTEIARHRPFPEAEFRAGARLYLGFLRQRPGEAARRKALTLRSAIDDFHFRGREVYWLSRKYLGDSKLSSGSLEKALAAELTLRNLTTVEKIVAQYI